MVITMRIVLACMMLIFAASVVSADIWVAGEGASRLLKMSDEGNILAASSDLRTPVDLDFDPGDESIWVVDEMSNLVVKLDKEGNTLFKIGYRTFIDTRDIRYQPANSWYGAVRERIPKTSEINMPKALAVDPEDSSVWIANAGLNTVMHVDKEGNELGSYAGFRNPQDVTVNKRTGEVWIANTDDDTVIKMSKDGRRMFAKPGFYHPVMIELEADGTAWVVDSDHDEIVKVNQQGNILLRTKGLDEALPARARKRARGYKTFSNPMAIGIDDKHKTVWVADTENYRLVRLGMDGITKSVVNNLPGKPMTVKVDSEGNVYVTMERSSHVLKVSPSGRIIGRIDEFTRPWTVLVVPSKDKSNLLTGNVVSSSSIQPSDALQLIALFSLLGVLIATVQKISN